MMNIALTDTIQRLLRKKVENGQFPNEEAVIQEALTRFLIEAGTHNLDERLPGPFIEDEMALAPVELPRSGAETSCLSLSDGTRKPTLFPGE